MREFLLILFFSSIDFVFSLRFRLFVREKNIGISIIIRYEQKNTMDEL